MKVLVVEDEPAVQRHLGRAFARRWAGASVTTASPMPGAGLTLRGLADVVTVYLVLPPARVQLLGLGLVEGLARGRRADSAVVITGGAEGPSSRPIAPGQRPC